MHRYFVSVCLAVLVSFALLACTNSSPSSPMTNPPGASTVPVSISIHDTPPAGVSVLRFEILVTAATLQPATMGQQPVNMLLQPQDVELIHLQTESALLGNLNVPTGMYNSLSVSFANPEMTIFNQSATTYTVGAQSCQPGEVCVVVPTLNQAMISVSSSPFPLTLTASSPVALDLHFDVNASVQGDLSVTPTVSVDQIQVPPVGQPEHMHLLGTVTAVSSPTITLQSVLDGATSTVTTDSNTRYFFGNTCAADNFSCIAQGQLLRVLVNVMSDGTLEAKDVKLIQIQGLPAVQGTVLSVNAANNQFQVGLAFDAQPQGGGPQPGIPSTAISLIVQVSSSTMFTIDSDELTLPAGVSFASIQDVVVGQTIEFQPILSSVVVSGAPPNIQVTVGASSVQLEPSQLTATVTAVNAQASPPNFVLGSLPMLFTAAGINQIQVDAVMGTDFDNVSGIGSLSTGQKVSVSGLLFNTATQPTIVAEDIRVRAPDGND